MGGFFLEAFIAFCWGNRLIAQFWVLVAGGRIHGLIVDLMILLLGRWGRRRPTNNVTHRSIKGFCQRHEAVKIYFNGHKVFTLFFNK